MTRIHIKSTEKDKQKANIQITQRQIHKSVPTVIDTSEGLKFKTSLIQVDLGCIIHEFTVTGEEVSACCHSKLPPKVIWENSSIACLVIKDTL